MDNILDVINGCTKHFAAAFAVAGLDKLLHYPGPFTLFAPSDAAFAAIQQDIDNWMMPGNKGQLTKVLMYHLLVGKVMASDFKDGQTLVSVEGKNLQVSFLDGKKMIGCATITSADIPASNGVVHIINQVLIPPS